VPSFKSLAELAAWHEQQADPLARPHRRVAVLVEHQQSAVLLRRMIGNRALTDPNRLVLAGPLPGVLRAIQRGRRRAKPGARRHGRRPHPVRQRTVIDNSPEAIDAFLRPRPVRGLPGVGTRTAATLTEYGLHSWPRAAAAPCPKRPSTPCSWREPRTGCTKPSVCSEPGYPGEPTKCAGQWLSRSIQDRFPGMIDRFPAYTSHR
jgi:hypothetical protein